MEIEQILGFATATASPSRAMSTLKAISEFDRYQASKGIVSAAHCLRDILREEGICEAELHLIKPGSSRPWNFDLPESWTPCLAELSLPDGAKIELSRHPLLLAVNSRELNEVSLPVRAYTPGSWNKQAEKLALVNADDFDFFQLAEDGVKYFATITPTVFDIENLDVRGRLEIPPTLQQTGFSLDQSQFQRLTQCAKQESSVRVKVEIDKEAPLPLLTWTIPGGLPGEIWVMAHLCHQHPGANDNASGVAGLAEVSRILTLMEQKFRYEQRKTIRFFTGPEFTGIAAFLRHHWSADSSAGRPEAVVNLDMIGQDCERNSGSFRVERCPMAYRNDLCAIGEFMTRKTFDPKGWKWSPMEFHGYSDNSIFTAGPFSCPTIQLCHDKDRYNHTSEDKLERISPSRLSAVVAITAATVAVASLGTVEADLWRKKIVQEWLIEEAVGIEEKAQIAIARGDTEWADSFRKSRMRTIKATSRAQLEPAKIQKTVKSNLFCDGPLNLRGLMQNASNELKAKYATRLATDKEVYAFVMNAVVAASKGVPIKQCAKEASYSLGRPIDNELADVINELLEQMSRPSNSTAPK